MSIGVDVSRWEDDFYFGSDDVAGTGGEWWEVEDEIIGAINDRLPEPFVCTVGEFCPGDVVVRAMGDDEV